MERREKSNSWPHRWLFKGGAIAVAVAGLVALTASGSALAAALTNVSVTASPSSPVVNQPVSFTATATTPTPGAVITEFQFSFGDGTVVTAPPSSIAATASATASHTYTSANSFLVSVNAMDSAGGTGTASTSTIVKASGGATGTLQVSLTPQPSVAAVDQPVDFVASATSSPGAILTNATVNFGDGSAPVGVVAGVPVVHDYMTPGTFTATLSAADSSGNTGQTSTQVAVGGSTAFGNNGVNGGLTFVNPQTTGAAGSPVTFTAAPTVGLACGNLATYTYNFGDGTVITGGPSISHAFSTAGNYNVTVTANCNGVPVATTTTPFAASSINNSFSTVAAASGVNVTFTQGWNIVDGPSGTVITGNQGPLYTYQATDAAYEVVPSGTPLRAGEGYWAYFPVGTSAVIPVSASASQSISLPAGHYVMIGNPGDNTATVTGADYMVTFSPSSNTYVQSTTIPAGGGAWVFSFNGGTATISSP
jgi:PKD domain